MTKKRSRIALAVVAVITATTLTSITSADAAITGSCPGYEHIQTVRSGNAKLDLFRNGNRYYSHDELAVLTATRDTTIVELYRTSGPSDAQPISTTLPRSSVVKGDYGQYKYYAGPVYLTAAVGPV